MTVTLSSASNFSALLTNLIQLQFEDELRATLPHLMDGNYRKATFLKGTNNVMVFNRMPDLAVNNFSDISGHSAGTPPWLTEAVSPTAEGLTWGTENFSAYQAGRRVELSDVALERDPHALMAQAAEKVARNGVETADAFVSYVINAGTNVLYAGTGNVARTDVAAGDVVTATLLRRANRTMKRDLIPTFADGKYRGIIEPGVVFDIEEDTSVGGWLQAAQYATIAGGLLTGELGSFAGFRFVESTNAFVAAAGGAAGIDVYSSFLFGPEAYVFGDWGSISGHVVQPGGHGDELAQVASVGWKGFFGAMLLDEAGPRYLRLESASDL